MHRPRSPLALLVLVAVVLGACGSSGSAVTATKSDSGSGAVDVVALDAQVRELLAMPQPQQEATIAALDTKVERELYTMSGLETELGGPAAADAAFRAAAHGILAPILAMQASPPKVGSFIAARPAPMWGDPNLGEAMFGAMMLVPLSVGAAIEASKDGHSGTRDVPLDPHGDADPNASMALSISSPSPDKVGFDERSEFTGKGVTTKLATKLKDLVVCPDVNGQFTGTIVVDMSATAAGGSTGQKATVEVSFAGQVDDQAEISAMEYEIHTQYAKFADSKGSYVDVTSKFGTGDSSTRSTGTLHRSGGNASAEFVADGAKLGAFLGMAMATWTAEKAKAAWQSGRCVRLEPTTDPATRDRLDLLQKVAITAAPRSKMDDGPVGGTVTATLAGASAVEPSGTPVPADATFTYTAAGEPGTKASVVLEARSRRGVAKASLEFATAGKYAYSFTGGLQGFQVANVKVCDIRGSFQLEMPGVAKAVFSGGDNLKGSYTATGMFNAKYTGTYTITLPDGPGKPGTMSAPSTGSTAGHAGGGTLKYTLTPLESCS